MILHRAGTGLVELTGHLKQSGWQAVGGKEGGEIELDGALGVY